MFAFFIGLDHSHNFACQFHVPLFKIYSFCQRVDRFVSQFFFQRRPIRRSVQWQKFKKGLQVETSSHIENIFTLAHNNIKKEMSILHFDHVHIINITCLIIINIIMTIFNISTLIIRAARDSGAKGDCRRLQRGCPLSIFNMPLFNSPWFQLNVYNCPLLISCVQVLDRPLPAIAVIKHIFHFAAFWKIVLLFGVKCFSPDCLWLIVAIFFVFVSDDFLPSCVF